MKLESSENRIIKILGGGSKHDNENKKLMEEIASLKKLLESKDSVINSQQVIIEEQANRKRNVKNVDAYTIFNIEKYFKTDESKKLLKNPEVFEYEEGVTSFEKNLEKNKNYYYAYQKRFIEDWSASQQELAILYYGVGTGKTMIAVNCAEQYLALNPDANVYFLSPASLVFVIIGSMFKAGIDPRRKNKKGEYVYNFLSYQQLLLSDFKFKENSLLIVDEIHNLRNFGTKVINEKISARKWKATDTYSLVGTKLGIKLLESDNKFTRSIFMSGTLFVNTKYDIEPIISIGYKKTPLTMKDVEEFDLIISDKDRMKLYFDGLISFYRKPSDTPNFPKTNYIFEPILVGSRGKAEDPFFIESRNEYNLSKIKWIFKYISENKNKRILVYAQFMDRMMSVLVNSLKKNKINIEVISGQTSPIEKLRINNDYNTGKLNILLFTLAIKEGISFKETDTFIFTQPYWNYAITEQVIARALRSDSHAKGNKSSVDVYMLCGIGQKNDSAKKLMDYFEKIMKNDIKTYISKNVETREHKNEKTGKTEKTYITDLMKATEKNYTRDVDMYYRMFSKISEINKFEIPLLNDVARFEQANNIENNEFIEEYNTYILEWESKNKKLLSLKDKIVLKRKMYSEFYEKEIQKTNKKFLRFKEDSRSRSLRNPDIAEKASKEIYANKHNQIIKMLETGKSLNDILNIFKVSKQEITDFQANFTPENEVEFLINQSGIQNDTRNKLFILEPTAGIGNVIAPLLKSKNVYNFNIDAVEIHNLFYQIGSARFDNIDNIKFYNMDFLKYKQKYNYDYILGNPPFNLRTQIDVFNNKTEKIEKIDKTMYDVDFVSIAYDMLNIDGTLTMIISDRFMRDRNVSQFLIFSEYLKIMEKEYPDYRIIRQVKNFKGDDTILKGMQTEYGMVCITLKKIKNFSIDLSKPPRTEFLKDLKTLVKMEKKENKPKPKPKPKPKK